MFAVHQNIIEINVTFPRITCDRRVALRVEQATFILFSALYANDYKVSYKLFGIPEILRHNFLKEFFSR